MNEFKILSGVGSKGPACMRLRVNGQVWLLDCGQGPEENAHFDPEWINGVDAVFITHDHIDHIGGAAYAVAAGVPIYTTHQTAKALPPAAEVRPLHEQGVVEINGVHLTTGRNGHALGGIWMHFDIGEGVFYSGDWSEESNWFEFDSPPPAATAILDCSYSIDSVTQKDRSFALDQLIDSLPGQILFPVPPSGRAGELALHLVERFGPDAVAFDQECRHVLRSALSAYGLRPRAQAIAPLLERVDQEGARFLICDTPNADGGDAQSYVRNWLKRDRLGRDAHVIFTGYLTAEARQICAKPGGYFRRWNVHPPLEDQINMLLRLQAKRFAPAFCECPEVYLTAPAVGADVFLYESVTL